MIVGRARVVAGVLGGLVASWALARGHLDGIAIALGRRGMHLIDERTGETGITEGVEVYPDLVDDPIVPFRRIRTRGVVIVRRR